MTMQTPNSPKPKIFGEGYGNHVAYNYRLMKKFFWLGWKMLVNMFIPAAFYERAHWEVVELYHKMRGYRHGINSDHRCNECGADIMTVDEVHDHRDELKVLDQECRRAEDCNNEIENIPTPEEYQFSKLSDDDLKIIEQRIEDIESGEVTPIDWRDLENE